MATDMEALHLPRLDLGIFKNSSRYLERVGKPTIPFQAPSWAAAQKPHAIALIDVYKANEVIMSVNVDSKPYFLFGRNALVCDIVLEHCSISRMHAALVHHNDGAVYLIDLGSCHGTFLDGEKLEPLQPTLLSHGAQLRFGVSSRTYRFKSYESRQMIEQRVQVAVGLQDEERELQMNTLLNRFLSYRLDGPMTACMPPPTNPWPQKSNRIASGSTDTNEDAQEETEEVTEDCNMQGDAPAPSRKRTRPSVVTSDPVFITYETKCVQFVDTLQIIPPWSPLEEATADQDMEVDQEEDESRPVFIDPSGAATPQPQFIEYYVRNTSETSRCGVPSLLLSFPTCDGRPSLATTTRIEGRRHTLG
ncbi:hypothetical protein LEN26_020485 [Aphanomyces euteiches]|nr:hypothetical protein LEN26_020485 [Aphanomyces euteiches]